MTTTADAVEIAAPRPRGGIVQSVNDSLVVAKRNLIRMPRIPSPRTASIQSNWPHTQGQRVIAGKGQVA